MSTPSPDINSKFFILQTGDEIQVDDEYYNPVTDAWLPVQPEFIGELWNEDESKPVRRRNKNWISDQEMVIALIEEAMECIRKSYILDDYHKETGQAIAYLKDVQKLILNNWTPK